MDYTGVDLNNDGIGDTPYYGGGFQDDSPIFIDSDDDEITDYREIYVYNTDPNNSDTDGDGFSDYEEIMIHNTDPNNSNDNFLTRLKFKMIIMIAIIVVVSVSIGLYLRNSLRNRKIKGNKKKILEQTFNKLIEMDKIDTEIIKSVLNKSEYDELIEKRSFQSIKRLFQKLIHENIINIEKIKTIVSQADYNLIEDLIYEEI